eukprot:jgi/Mesvir1/17562/Mv08805-RA.1
MSGNEAMVRRLELQQRLGFHQGCVNAVHFSTDGELLFSGSDDHQVAIWDWVAGKRRLHYHSGHTGNVFQCRPMPFTGNRTIVTCAADGQVRVGHLSDGGSVSTHELHRHSGRAHKLALDGGDAHTFFSCGEDGKVYQYDLRQESTRLLLATHSLSRGGAGRGSMVGLNSVVISPRDPWLLATGGLDEFARVYDRRMLGAGSALALGGWGAGERRRGALLGAYAPPQLEPSRRSAEQHRGRFNITCVAFSEQGELLASYNDELIYLFDITGHQRKRRAEYLATRSAAGRDYKDSNDSTPGGKGDGFRGGRTMEGDEEGHEEEEGKGSIGRGGQSAGKGKGKGVVGKGKGVSPQGVKREGRSVKREEGARVRSRSRSPKEKGQGGREQKVGGKESKGAGKEKKAAGKGSRKKEVGREVQVGKEGAGLAAAGVAGGSAAIVTDAKGKGVAPMDVGGPGTLPGRCAESTPAVSMECTEGRGGEGSGGCSGGRGGDGGEGRGGGEEGDWATLAPAGPESSSSMAAEGGVNVGTGGVGRGRKEDGSGGEPSAGNSSKARKRRPEAGARGSPRGVDAGSRERRRVAAEPRGERTEWRDEGAVGQHAVGVVDGDRGVVNDDDDDCDDGEGSDGGRDVTRVEAVIQIGDICRVLDLTVTSGRGSGGGGGGGSGGGRASGALEGDMSERGRAEGGSPEGGRYQGGGSEQPRQGSGHGNGDGNGGDGVAESSGDGFAEGTRGHGHESLQRRHHRREGVARGGARGRVPPKVRDPAGEEGRGEEGLEDEALPCLVSDESDEKSEGESDGEQKKDGGIRAGEWEKRMGGTAGRSGRVAFKGAAGSGASRLRDVEGRSAQGDKAAAGSSRSESGDGKRGERKSSGTAGRERGRAGEGGEGTGGVGAREPGWVALEDLPWVSEGEEEDEEEKGREGGGRGMCYKGHRNADTIKGVSFYGPRSEYVVSGSDCGRVFVWDKKSARVDLPEDAAKVMEENQRNREERRRTSLPFSPQMLVQLLGLHSRHGARFRAAVEAGHIRISTEGAGAEDDSETVECAVS